MGPRDIVRIMIRLAHVAPALIVVAALIGAPSNASASSRYSASGSQHSLSVVTRPSRAHVPRSPSARLSIGKNRASHSFQRHSSLAWQSDRCLVPDMDADRFPPAHTVALLASLRSTPG